MIRRWLALVALILSAATAAAAPLETVTDAERNWREVRGSDDVKTKRMAERWYGAIKLQEWGDASGKFKTTAKYVEHDPNMAWVKLRVIQGVGDTRVVKDVTIPLDKLSKSCQARVRTIGVLSEKVAEAIVEEQEQEAEDETDGGGRGGEMRDEQALAEEPRGGRGQYDAGLAGMDAEQALAEGSDPREPRDPRQSRDPRTNPPTESPASSDPTGVSAGISSDPLPAVLPPLPSGTALAADGSSPAESTASDQPAPPNLPDNDPWRTSYDAFRSNLLRTPEGVLANRESWEGMNLLQSLDPREPRRGEPVSEPEGDSSAIDEFQSVDALSDVGEFVWEANISGEVSGDANWAEMFQLPPMLEPFQIEFRLDQERGAGNWQQLKTGDRVRFIGRFIGFKGPYVWVAAIRFPAEQPVATETPSRDGRGR